MTCKTGPFLNFKSVPSGGVEWSNQAVGVDKKSCSSLQTCFLKTLVVQFWKPKGQKCTVLGK